MANYETIIPTYIPILQKTPLFGTIDPADYPELLDFLQASVRRFRKGQMLVNLGDPFRHIGIVLEGTLEGSFENENFDQINMNYFQKGALFGESLALANIEYSPIQLRALEDSLVIYLDPSVIYRTEAWDSPSKKTIIANLVRGLSLQNVFLNLKIRIHTQKSIRDKVLIYLYSLPAGPDGWKTVPFSQTALAEFLGVNRSALARELTKMKADGVLKTDRRRFLLL